MGLCFRHPPCNYQIMDKISAVILFIFCFSSGLPQYRNSVFARDLRGDLLYNVADTGMMMGLGKRNQNRRNAFLEDTGMILGLGKRYPSVEDEGILMGFGKRNT